MQDAPSDKSGNTVSAGKRVAGGRVDEAYQGILRIIKDAGLFEGSRLPSETEMASLFGISRPVVRQALSRLQQAGVVDIRWGAGNYVRQGMQVESGPVFQFSEVRSLEQIRHTFEVRRGIEAEVAGLAAERATARDRALIQQAYRKVQAALKGMSASQELDVAYHFAIAAAAHNPFYEQLMLAVRTPLLRCASIAKMLLGDADMPGRSQAIIGEHERILEAILARDSLEARSATRDHVDNAFKRVSLGQ